jgi:hypothetical protein
VPQRPAAASSASAPPNSATDTKAADLDDLPEAEKEQDLQAKYKTLPDKEKEETLKAAYKACKSALSVTDSVLTGNQTRASGRVNTPLHRFNRMARVRRSIGAAFLRESRWLFVRSDEGWDCACRPSEPYTKLNSCSSNMMISEIPRITLPHLNPPQSHPADPSQDRTHPNHHRPARRPPIAPLPPLPAPLSLLPLLRLT